MMFATKFSSLGNSYGNTNPYGTPELMEGCHFCAKEDINLNVCVSFSSYMYNLFIYGKGRKCRRVQGRKIRNVKSM